MKYFEVVYKNAVDEVVDVVRVNRVRAMNRGLLIEYQRTLLDSFCYFNGNVGSVLLQKDVIATIEKIAAICPTDSSRGLDLFSEKITVGGKEVDIVPLIEDLEQMSRIFFSTSFNEEDGELDLELGWKASLISRCNLIDFGSELVKAIEAMNDLKTTESLERATKATKSKSKAQETTKQTS